MHPRVRRTLAAAVALVLWASVFGAAGAAFATSNSAVTIPVGNMPEAVAVNATTHTVYVANTESDTVSVIDGATNTITVGVDVGKWPDGVAVDAATNTVYVANDLDGTVSVINGATNAVTATVVFPGRCVAGLAVNAATNTLYVINCAVDALVVVDGATNTVSTEAPIGADAAALAVDSATNTVYVANNQHNSLSVINGATNTVSATVALGAYSNGVAVDESTDTVYVTNWLAHTLSVVSGATNTVTATVAVGTALGAPVVDPATNAVYVITGDDVSVIDAATDTVSATIAVGPYPAGVAVDEATNTVYVTNSGNDSVSVLPGAPGFPVNAWFQAEWQQLGGALGQLGWPTAPMRCQVSTCWQQFAGGVLTSDGHEIVKLSSAYVSTWLAWGGPNGDLGLVSGPEACYGTYCETPFAGGEIAWVPNVGVFPVAKRWFYPSWISHGGASGSLGLPAAAMQCQSVACYQVFQHGTLTSSTSGIVALSSEYVTTWLSNGGPDGALGLVAGPETCYSTSCRVPFQHGTLVWQPGVGVHLAT